jgi:plasmid stability protein
MNNPQQYPKKIRINQSLDADLHRRLKIRAAEERLSLQETIEDLLRRALLLNRQS